MTEDGFFRIGDVGRIDEDGYLYITGRAKDMIISGGVNIYPAEVEQALGEHPDVIEAAVIGVPDEDLGERVVAFCEVRPDSAVTEDDLLSTVARQLAPFKRPRRVELIGELPRNALGKVMKTTLREPFWPDRRG